MVGIAGHVCRKPSTDISDSLIEKLGSHLEYTGEERKDLWESQALSGVRVHHGVTNAAPQPIYDEERSVSIAMIGEVYDYADQKADLEEARYEFEYPDNDAEFCLFLYLEEGADAFKSLNGTYNIVIHDLRTDEVILVNDRFSAIPLFYYDTEGAFVFANSVSAFSELPYLDPTLDVHAVVEFFTFQRTFGNRTYYREVKMVEPGTIVTVTEEGTTFESYWDVRYDYQSRSTDEAATDLADAIVEAVARRVHDGRDFGLFLSGGIDSRAILAGFLSNNVDVSGFTFGGDRYSGDDVRVGTELASTAGIHHQVVDPAEEMLNEDVLRELVHIGDGMHRVDHGPMREFIENVDGIDVGFHGLELDYTIGGTLLRSKTFSILGRDFPLPVMRDFKTRDYVRGIKDQLKDSYRADLQSSRFFENLSESDTNEFIETTIGEAVESLGEGKAGLYSAFEYFWYFPAYKSHVHLNDSSMATRIPTRAIIYDTDLFDQYLRLQPKHRYNRKVLSIAVNKINPDLAAVENSNTGYRADIPRTLTWFLQAKDFIHDGIQRTISGDDGPSYTGLGAYIRRSPRLQELIWETMHDPKAIDPALLNVEAFETCYHDHMDGRSDNIDPLLKVLTFGMWHRKYGPANLA